MGVVEDYTSAAVATAAEEDLPEVVEICSIEGPAVAVEPAAAAAAAVEMGKDQVADTPFPSAVACHIGAAVLASLPDARDSDRLVY